MGLGSGIRDPGSGKNLFRILDPGSRGQEGTGSRIRDPDPQHCLKLLSHSLNKIKKDSDDILKDDEIFVYNIVTKQEKVVG